jgi:hypothetical protein
MLHHRDPVGDLADHGEVMRDEEHGETVRTPQSLQQRQDLCLHGHVERGGRLVRNQQPRPVHDRHRNQNPLALAAGKLMRIVAQAALGLRQRDLAHRVEHPPGDFGFSQAGMVRLHRLCDLLAHAHHWVQRRHRLLKDHGQIAAAPPPHLRLRQPQQVNIHRPVGLTRREEHSAADVRLWR